MSNQIKLPGPIETNGVTFFPMVPVEYFAAGVSHMAERNGKKYPRRIPLADLVKARELAPSAPVCVITGPLAVPCVFPRSCSHQSLPIDRRYHRLRYETFIDGKPAPVEKVIGRARLRVNGRDIVALPLACIRALNQELGVPDRENAVTLWLADPRSASPAETAWDMYGEHDFTAVLWMCEKIDGTPSICGEMTFDYGHTLDGSGKIVKKVIHRHALTLSDGGEMIREIHAASFDET